MTSEELLAWRDAAAADGWEVKPTYAGESIDRAARGTRDGFVFQIINRPEHRGHYELSAWGPDRLAVKVSPVYSWEVLVANLRTCLQCGATDVDVQRAGFAGRYCATCLPGQRKAQESGNWTS